MSEQASEPQMSYVLAMIQVNVPSEAANPGDPNATVDAVRAVIGPKPNIFDVGYGAWGQLVTESSQTFAPHPDRDHGGEMTGLKRTVAEVHSNVYAPFAEAVETERAYQDRKWGGRPHDREHPLPEWALILNREVGEVNDAVGRVFWRGGWPGDLRAELVQVAAVCAAMIEVLDERVIPVPAGPGGEVDQ